MMFLLCFPVFKKSIKQLVIIWFIRFIRFIHSIYRLIDSIHSIHWLIDNEWWIWLGSAVIFRSFITLFNLCYVLYCTLLVPPQFEFRLYLFVIPTRRIIHNAMSDAAKAFISFLRCEAKQAEDRARSLRATAAIIEANNLEGECKLLLLGYLLSALSHYWQFLDIRLFLMHNRINA